jgi:hypothetical protein
MLCGEDQNIRLQAEQAEPTGRLGNEVCIRSNRRRPDRHQKMLVEAGSSLQAQIAESARRSGNQRRVEAAQARAELDPAAR